MNNFKIIKDFSLNLLFPKFCLGCKKEGSYLCQDCISLLDICEYNYSTDNKHLLGLYFALPYKENTLTKKLIYQFKYEPYLKDLSKILASLLVEHFIKTSQNTNQMWENSVLIPVPLDKTKLIKRGYNQSEELAKELSKIIKVPVAINVLIKTKKTAPQMELKKEEREKNLLGAFAIENFASVANKKIFLVDDVYTTGSTMAECAKVLKKSGSKQIYGIALAREE